MMSSLQSPSLPDYTTVPRIALPANFVAPFFIICLPGVITKDMSWTPDTSIEQCALGVVLPLIALIGVAQEGPQARARQQCPVLPVAPFSPEMRRLHEMSGRLPPELPLSQLKQLAALELATLCSTPDATATYLNVTAALTVAQQVCLEECIRGVRCIPAGQQAGFRASVRIVIDSFGTDLVRAVRGYLTEIEQFEDHDDDGRWPDDNDIIEGEEYDNVFSD